MSLTTIEKLLEAGAHFGHLTRRWNPKMQPFIFGERNGIHIIDLRKTLILLEIARNAVHEIASQGKMMLFVGTKPLIKQFIQNEAQRSRTNWVSERWLGGMLTNFQTIRKSIKRLNTIDKMEVDGTFEKLTKKERLLLHRERDRLRKFFGGIEEMTRLPSALFVIDIKKEHIAIKEAKILGIPVIAICDTNTDPELVDYPIPANDDSIKTVELITKIMADAIIEGTELSRIRMADLTADTDKAIKEQDISTEDEQPKVRRKLRQRTSKTEEKPQQKKSQPKKTTTTKPNESEMEETSITDEKVDDNIQIEKQNENVELSTNQE